MTTKSYRIVQDGMPVAGVDGAKDNTEIMHYAMQYVEDGPLTVEEKNPKTGRWKVIYDFNKGGI